MASTADLQPEQVMRVRLRYIRQCRACGPLSGLLKRQVKPFGHSWGPDWSALHRNTAAQIDLARFIDTKFRPDAISVLYVPDRLNSTEFRRRVEAWRVRCGRLHPADVCPSRRFRKFEYVLALEYGLHPKGSRSARLHAHILLYNLLNVRLDDLGREWRELNGIRKSEEPLIEPYCPGPEGIEYCLKTLGTDADQIYFSRKLALSQGAAS
jgi:hypothetical protein